MKTRASSLARISRRGLIGSGAVASLLAAGGVSASVPRAGGTLRLAVPSNLMTRLIAPGSAFDCLTEMTADGRLRGELAERWTSDRGAKRWTIALRKDAQFHDGQPLTPADVIASLKEAGWPGFASVRKAGPHLVEIVLVSPDPGLPFMLAEPRFVIRPAAGGLVGTGLYRLDVVDESRARLTRIADHPRGAGRGWFSAIEILAIDEPLARAEALLSGRVDAATAIAPGDRARLLRSPRVSVVTQRTDRLLALRAQGPQAPALAAALKIGIDRSAMVRRGLGGHGRVAWDHPLDVPTATVTPDFAAARERLAVRGHEALKIALEPSALEIAALDGVLGEIRVLARRLGLKLEAVSPDAADLVIALFPAAATEGAALRSFAVVSGLSENCTGDSIDSARRIAESGLVCAPAFVHETYAYSTRLGHAPAVGAHDALDAARIAERWFFT